MEEKEASPPSWNDVHSSKRSHLEHISPSMARVKIQIVPDECFFEKDEIPTAITKSIRIRSNSERIVPSTKEDSLPTQLSLNTEGDIPTQWSADLREGLAMVGIDYTDIPDSQFPQLYRLYTALSYPFNEEIWTLNWYSSRKFPLVMSRDALERELKTRNVFYRESDTRDALVCLLETDILLRSKGVKGVYVDYRMRRVTAFDIFNDLFGDYTGPMLSDLLKKKGIKPPRKLVDRIQILVNAIDGRMREVYKNAFSEVTKEYYANVKGRESDRHDSKNELSVNSVFHTLLQMIPTSLGLPVT